MAASMTILAIDPGPAQSAWLALVDGQPNDFGIWPNEQLLEALRDRSIVRRFHGIVGTTIVIEQIVSYGMAVGAEVFATVHWSGRFTEAASPTPVVQLPRLKVKQALCHDSRAKDPNIRQALIDRFGGPDAIRKGGALYGVSKDVWSALGVAVTWAEIGAAA